MNYNQWNNAISSFFFNDSKAGQEVYLFVTSQDIISIGKENGLTANNENIFKDFINAMIYSLYDLTPTKSDNAAVDIFDDFKIPCCPIDTPISLYNNWKSCDQNTVMFPPYIAYLALYILPLTEDAETKYNSNNYYDRVNDFFKKYGIMSGFKFKKIGSLNFCYLDVLWSDLENWSIILKNTELGYFELHPFKNKKWIYVGKPFSQCIFPPRAILKLPQLFLEANLLPKSFYPDSEFKRILVKYGANILTLNKSVIDLIHKCETDDLGHSIIEIVKREYSNWSGESHELIDIGSSTRAKRNFIPARLYLQFKINNNDEDVKFSFRMFSQNEYPEDLKFNDFSNLYELKGWSKALNIEFSESIELIDETNKWILRFPENDVRLFVSAGIFQLSSDYWLETDELYRNSWMYLLCKDKLSGTISEWGAIACREFINHSDFDGVPSGYSLFKFLHPNESHPDIPLLTLSSIKTIRLINGLKLDYKTFLSNSLPEIEVTNATGEEVVYINYRNTDVEIILNKKHLFENIWVLPSDIEINANFYIKIKDEQIEGNRFSYCIADADYSSLSNDVLIKRNKFLNNPSQNEPFFQGNHFSINEKFDTVVNQQLFYSYKTSSINFSKLDILCGSSLLDWLVAVKKCNLQAFNEAFEYVYFNNYSFDNTNIQHHRKSAINLFDYLGFIDYNYSDNEIITLPLKIICIPSKQGKRALLIGGRDKNILDRIVSYCSNHSKLISVSFEKQNSQNNNMLLPCAVLFESNSTNEFNDLAKYLNIDFDEYFILKLLSMTPSLKEYEEFILSNCQSDSQEDFEWARKIFDTTHLQFVTTSAFDKEYTLVEYTLSPYWKEYGLWINGRYYRVDKNWGRFLAINHYSPKESGYNRSVQYSRPGWIFSNNNKLAVSAYIPFPKLVSRAFLSLSGIAPEFKELSLNPNCRWYNVYSNIPSTFIDNFFRFKLNMNIETTSNLL